MERLAIDECTIGKVPNVMPEQYESLFADWRSLTPDGLITWHVFAEGCNEWPWKILDNSKRIDDFFAQANKLKMQGKKNLSCDLAGKALRLQGILSRTKSS